MSTMVRINAMIRDEIINNVIKFKFAKEDVDLEALKAAAEAEREKAEELAYEACFTDVQRKILSEYSAYGFFPVVEGVNIRIEHNESGNYEDKRVLFGEKKPVPYKAHKGSIVSIIPASHPYVLAFAKAKEAEVEYSNSNRELREKKSAMKAKVFTVVDSVTTIKRLTEIWPEITEFLPEKVSGSGGGLPAYIISDLNAEIGLGEKKENSDEQ